MDTLLSKGNLGHNSYRVYRSSFVRRTHHTTFHHGILPLLLPKSWAVLLVPDLPMGPSYLSQFKLQYVAAPSRIATSSHG